MARRPWSFSRTMFVLLSITLALGACARPIASQLAPGADAAGSASPGTAPLRTPTSQILEAYGRLPLHFEENRGQAHPSVRFLARTESGPVGLTPKGLTLGLDGTVVSLTFAGAAPAPRMEALEPLPGVANYYFGSDGSRWRTGIPTSARVRYEAVYPGIDVVVYGNQRRLEYDFVVAPGADPGRIRVRVDGADAVEIDRAGDLRIQRAGRTIVQHAPVVYQERDGRREPVRGRYVMRGREVGIALAAYDRSRLLVIDPVIEFSAKIGPAGGRRIAVDDAGFILVAGLASGESGYPMVNPAAGPTHCCFTDAVVTKLTPNADSLIYSTFIGTFANEEVAGIVADSAGNAWVLGTGAGHGALGPAGFPKTSDAAMPQGPGGSDSATGWLAKFSPTGSLLYGTYITGTSTAPGFRPSGACLLTHANGLAIDASDHVYVVGTTLTKDYPTTPGAYQTSRAGDPNTDWCAGGGSAAFVTKFTPGGALAYSTYLDTAGGTENVATAVAVDAAGNAYVAAVGPPPYPFTTVLTADGGTAGGHIVKLDVNGFPIWATAVGVIPDALALGPDASLYFVGSPGSGSSPPTTVNAFQAAPTGPFVARLNAAGNAYVWSTYVGGSGSDALNDIAVDSAGAAWLAGSSSSTDFPLKDPIKTKTGTGSEVVVVKLSATGGLAFGTFLGTAFGEGITTDAADNVYVTGGAGPDFPKTAGTYAGSETGLFVLKLAEAATAGPESVVWTSAVKAAVSGNSVTKTSGCEGCADAGAISQQTIASGDGFVQFSVSPQEYLTVGLSTGNPGTSGSEIKFGLRFHAGSPAAVQVRESGVYKAEFLHIAGATYKIAVEGGVVKYFQNGALKYTSTVAPTYPLLVDTSLLTLGAAVQNAMISAGGGGGGGGGDTIAPTVAITSPENGATVSGTVTVTATATDNVAVTSVTFRVGTQILAQDTAAPYAVEWGTTFIPPGTYTVTAEAKDAAGNTAVSAVTVTVTDSQTPHVTITSPPFGATVSDTVTLTAHVNDNVGVVGVQFKLDGVDLGFEVTTNPPYPTSGSFSMPWDTKTAANGTHSLTAVARDEMGNTKTSSPITVTVSNDGPPPGPSPQPVTWTSAVNVAVSGNTITKNAGCNGCSDAGAISQQTIPSGSGSVSFTVGAGSQMTVGLGTGNAGTGGTDVEFGLRFYPGSPGYVEVRESGAYKWDFAHVAGATYKVAVEAGVVKYYQNGTLKYTSAAAPSFPLVVDTSLVATGSAVQNAVIGP